jgi:hypothetical protein
VDAFVDVDGVEAEDVLGLELFLLLGVALLLGMALEVVVDDAGEGGIPYGSSDFLSALNASVFLVVDQLSEAAPAETMVAGLHSYGDGHDLIAEGAGDLVLDGLGEVTGRVLLLLLLLPLGFLILLSLLLVLFLHPLLDLLL